jgi:hypothetical protein
MAVNKPKAAELASGPGEVAMIPFFRDITDQDEELQLENAEPLIDNIITAGVMKAVDYGCNDVACGVLRPEQKSALWARHSIRVPELRGRKEAKDKTAGWTRWVLHGEGVTPPRHGSPTAAGSGRWLRIQHPKKPERPNSRRGATVRSGVC